MNSKLEYHHSQRKIFHAYRASVSDIQKTHSTWIKPCYTGGTQVQEGYTLSDWYQEIQSYRIYYVSLAPQFKRYTVYWVSRVLLPRDCFQVVYIFALHSSLNTTTFCFLHIFPVTYPTYCNLFRYC